MKTGRCASDKLDVGERHVRLPVIGRIKPIPREVIHRTPSAGSAWVALSLLFAMRVKRRAASGRCKLRRAQPPDRVSIYSGIRMPATRLAA